MPADHTDQTLAPDTRLPHLWVDADACPVVIKEIIFRAAERLQLPTVLVANQLLRVPPSKVIRAVQVAQGFDEADHWIASQALPGDLVITADIPLAAEVVGHGVAALNPRGEFYSAENIRERLNMRDFMETLRSSGQQLGGPAPFSASDRQAFGRSLDRFLAKIRR
ncbi:YaiI/YqxD family protein [Chitinibacter tainanensis]|uniref:YaiI/YqxD family protein n=1 Tax=Chitinibacter tainanensis TaxID=230667 RepID=UPI00041AD14E|nr:YaiI/YqxD family protein [Chitinibacter tainanensis]